MRRSNCWMHVNDGEPGTAYEAGPIGGTPSDPLYIGNVDLASWGAFDGALDDIRIYNRALTAGEIAEIYALGPARAPVATYQLLLDE